MMNTLKRDKSKKPKEIRQLYFNNAVMPFEEVVDLYFNQNYPLDVIFTMSNGDWLEISSCIKVRSEEFPDSLYVKNKEIGDLEEGTPITFPYYLSRVLMELNGKIIGETREGSCYIVELLGGDFDYLPDDIISSGKVIVRKEYCTIATDEELGKIYKY